MPKPFEIYFIRVNTPNFPKISYVILKNVSNGAKTRCLRLVRTKLAN